MTDEYYMLKAIDQAKIAFQQNEVPVGAVLVLDGKIISRGYNQPICQHDPTAHAEIVALRQAGSTVSNYRIPDSTLYVTVEPCTMCFGALIHSRVSRVVYGAEEPKAGVLHGSNSLLNSTIYNHRLQITAGVLATECSELMTTFFKKQRDLKLAHKKTENRHSADS